MKRSVARRAAAVIAAVGAFAVIAAPAVAADGDIVGSKTNDASGTLADGDTVGFTVTLDNPSANDLTDVTLVDTPDAGLVYVPGSTVVEVTAPSTVSAIDPLLGGTGVSGGTGWSTDWTVLGSGIYRPGGLAGVRIAGFPATAARTVSLPAGPTSNQVVISTTHACIGPAAAELGITIEAVGSGVVYSVGALSCGTVGDTTFTVTSADYSELANATGLIIRLGLNGPLPDPGPSGADYFLVESVAMDISRELAETYDNSGSGPNPQLADGSPASLVGVGDGIDLPAGAGLVVTYDMQIDAAAAGTATTLANNAAWTAAEDSGASATSAVAFSTEVLADTGASTEAQGMIAALMIVTGALAVAGVSSRRRASARA